MALCGRTPSCEQNERAVYAHECDLPKTSMTTSVVTYVPFDHVKVNELARKVHVAFHARLGVGRRLFPRPHARIAVRHALRARPRRAHSEFVLHLLARHAVCVLAQSINRK